MRLFICLGILNFGLILALFIAELLCRLSGISPGPLPVAYAPSMSLFKEPYFENYLTGWQLKPGKYRLILGGLQTFSNVSVNPDASRATRRGNNFSFGTQKIVFIGDSFIFGEGLNDEESLPWRLQELLPNKDVINHAVGGYGTCQAMLRLEQLSESLSPGDIVVYGLSGFHEERNVADPRQDYWVALSSPNRKSGYPRCRLSNNEIFREDSKEWKTLLPLTGKSVLSKVFTDAWLSVLAIETAGNQRDLTYSLIAKMKSISINRGALLVVLLQDVASDAATEYQKFLERSQIRYLDGTTVAARNDWKLPDGHPGPKMADYWATSLHTFLSQKPETATP